MAKGGARNHAGRKRKPTEMKVVQGTFRGDRHGTEAVVEAKWPDPPAHLSERERVLWDGLKEQCGAWVAPSDWMSINGCVSLMDRILKIQEAQQAGDGAGKPLAFKYTPSADGEPNMEPKDNPLFTMELKFWTGLRGYIAILGLSPADRAKVAKPGGEEKPVNPLSRFIKGSGA
jgi:hypothetical protein